jgi:exopolyphosphatase/guanosine-5'-triphosphate,3'-diphosphate pyrophosphatase
MDDASSARGDGTRAARVGAGEPQAFAAVDLGTNNCRLLIAHRRGDGFRIVDSFSRIVRLGEGLGQSGRLADAAMGRALGALHVCAAKIRKRGAVRVRAVATQACRSAANGAEFIARVADETGLELAIISPRQEAALSVAGCLNLLDPDADAALVVDVGGGSTELSWVDLSALDAGAGRRRPAVWRSAVKAWLSVPIGVVTLAERFPEAPGGSQVVFAGMVELMKARIGSFSGADSLKDRFAAGRAHLVGTSGAITSLAGLHLKLARYDRSRVDGLWMTRSECDAVAARLLELTTAQRAAQPCIGPDRADLVLAGAAILAAVQELWPCERVRVADRGLREGLLLSLIAEERRRSRRRGPRRAREVPR